MKDSVDRLKSKLYSPVGGVSISSDIRTPMSAQDKITPTQWKSEDVLETQEEDMRPPITRLMETTEAQEQYRKTPFVAKFFVASFLFFLIATGLAAYVLFIGSNLISPNNVDIQLVAPSLVNGGKISTIETIITNRNKSSLKNVTITTVFPQGAREASTSVPLQREQRVVGDLISGSQIKHSSQAVFYGSQGERQRVVVTLEYGIEGSAATFQKQEEIEFIVGSSPVAVLVSMPKEAISGQLFTIDLTVQASGATSVDDVAIEARYPSGFKFVSSSPVAARVGSLWQIGTIKPGEVHRISITGTLLAQGDDEKVFHFSSGTLNDPTDAHIDVPFLTMPSTLTMRRPFMATNISFNGEQGSGGMVVGAGENVHGVIQYTNTLTTPVSNATIILALKGSSFDAASVDGLGGFYQSADHTVTWDSQNTPALAYIAPGGTGSLQFNFKSKESGTNSAVTLGLTVSGVRTGSVDVPETLSEPSIARVTVASTVLLAAQSLHFAGPFTNGGPTPPVPGERTSYSIVWSVKNSSNAVANAKVSASLPAYVEFAEAQEGSGVVYDSSNRLVTWSLGDLAAGTGFSVPIRQAAFRVVLTPSNTQVGKSPALTGPVNFTGVDRFAKSSLRASTDPPTTMLSDDPSFTEEMGVVTR